jgi:hypothetical protein
MYSNRGENPHSPRFRYAELRANGCTSLSDSLYSQITSNTEATWRGSGGNFARGLRPKKNRLWFSPVVFPFNRTYDVLRQSSAACKA